MFFLPFLLKKQQFFKKIVREYFEIFEDLINGVGDERTSPLSSGLIVCYQNAYLFFSLYAAAQNPCGPIGTLT